MKRLSSFFISGLSGLLLILAVPSTAKAKSLSAIEMTQQRASLQIRNLVEPLLEKYCREECRLMSIDVLVDEAIPDEIAPGFDDIDPRSGYQLAPVSAELKLLIDEKVGPVSRSKLLDLIDQYLDTMDYPVRINQQLTRFPQPIGSASKIAELREKVTHRFRTTLETLFAKFCPDRCMLADYDLQTETVNVEEAQYGNPGAFLEEGGIAVRIKKISGTILVDDSLSPEERNNVLEMARLKTGLLDNVELNARSMRFPQPVDRNSYGRGGGRMLGQGGYSSETESSKKEKLERTLASETTSNSVSENSQTTSNQLNQNSEVNSTNNNTEVSSYQRFEKVERVENGDAVQAEIKKVMLVGGILAASIIVLLGFIIFSIFRSRSGGTNETTHIFKNIGSDGPQAGAPRESKTPSTPSEQIHQRYEIERLLEELTKIYVENPKVAKYVFSRILIEEGVEAASDCMQLFGESIVVDMLRDPSMQGELNELLEFYAKNPTELKDEEKIDLLKQLHNRTIAGKLTILGRRTSNLFDFLIEMDGTQILELIRGESLTVKSIILTQCDPQKRAAIYSQLDEETKLKLMTELSRIDYLPRDYIFNVATALKRKVKENPRLNTEALPGSDVLLTLLERTSRPMQRKVLKKLEMTNPDSARHVKGKLVTLDTLKYLRDNHLLEIVLSLKHEELLHFLKGAPKDIRETVFSKSPKDLVADLEEELAGLTEESKGSYDVAERKILNRLKLMAHDGLVSLLETNDRMLADPDPGFDELEMTGANNRNRMAAGW